MFEEQRPSICTSPQATHRPQTHHQNLRSGSRKNRRSADHSTLVAIGSWSSHKTGHGDRHALSNSRNESTRYENGLSYQHAPYDDFNLFPEEGHTDDYEDVSAYTEQPSAPLAPRIPRFRTPDIAPLSTDVQFFPCLGDEPDEDRINEAWYLAGRDRVLSQMEEAMAYMSIVGGR
ncbi:uncharacterized protein LY79DRAFT_528031 [Colletotrichum navitas]|uniref:Uncharacterized protein n=1 Tax=Colletotrichum navitas TaxID=681940 RepID=A0AAD8PL88_9PEZI|nr:uncharacterized protein LY79DRAFT_528031 [Colletotrichum navitas]KAK1569771.1 hypothetical protein LY79DRAFT_528031 [Colletotrichum navitas]